MNFTRDFGESGGSYGVVLTLVRGLAYRAVSSF